MLSPAETDAGWHAAPDPRAANFFGQVLADDRVAVQRAYVNSCEGLVAAFVSNAEPKIRPCPRRVPLQSPRPNQNHTICDQRDPGAQLREQFAMARVKS